MYWKSCGDERIKNEPGKKWLMLLDDLSEVSLH